MTSLKEREPGKEREVIRLDSLTRYEQKRLYRMLASWGLEKTFICMETIINGWEACSISVNPFCFLPPLEYLLALTA